MAIYQFLTFVLPRKTIEKEFGRIPSKIDFNLNMNGNRTKKWWKNYPLEFEYLEQKIDMIISRTDWVDLECMSWKSEKSQFDHDVNIDFNIKEKYIEEFQFRTDLTDKSFSFLKYMLELLEQNDLILMDKNGNLCNPNMKEFSRLIKDSDTSKFLQNPNKYLEKDDN